MNRVHVGIAGALVSVALSAACSGLELPPGPGASSSSSGGNAGDTDPTEDASVDARCPAAFELAGEELACDAELSSCAGEAHPVAGALELTSSDSSADDPHAGVYWRALAVPRQSTLTLTADVAVVQPPGGGIQGHGFAFAFVQADGDPATPPGARTEQPAYMGINVLEGFHGAAAYVKTYDGGTSGVLALRSTTIPSGQDQEVDGWNSGVGNKESFGRTDDVYLRFVFQVRPDAAVNVEMIRFDDDSYENGRSIQTLELTLPDMQRIDYFGIAAARGNDAYSQSGHRIARVSLTCPE